MKKFNQKFHRIIALFCALVMLVTSVELSPYLFVRAEEETVALAPIGVAFDSEDKVAAAKANYGVVDNSGGFKVTTSYGTDEEADKKYMHIVCEPNGNDTNLQLQYHNFASQSGLTSVNLADYPYVKISYRHDIVEGNPIGWETMNLKAINSNGQMCFMSGYVGDLCEDPDDEWKEILFNFKEGTYGTFSVYDEEGNRESGGSLDSENSCTWEGVATSFRFDPVYNSKAATTMDIEYIALFATEEEALAYPNTPAKLALEEDLESAEFSATFAEASTVASAEQIAGAQIQDIIDAQETISGSDATYTMSNSKFYFNRTGGVFTSDVAVTMPGQITIHFALNMTITGRTSPITVIFDSEDKVTAAKADSGVVVNGGFDGQTSFEVDEETGKKYMHIVCEPNENLTNLDLKYCNFASQSGLTSINLEDYPYVKISYRHDIVDGNPIGWESMSVRASSTESSFGPQMCYMSGYVDDLLSDPDDEWKEILFKFNEGEYGKFDVYDKDGDFDQQNGTISSETGSKWEGEAKALRFDLIYASRAATTMDIEYIALFATEAEALAYSSSMDSDVTTLEGANFSCKGTKVSTADAAYNELKAQIEALGLQNAYTLEEGTFTAASSTEDGSYVANVALDPANKVQVTMTIVAPKEPLRVVFSSQDKVKAAYVDGATKSFVNETDSEGKKYMHLEWTGNDDKWIRYANFADQCGVGYVDFDVYKYVKMSFRRIAPDKGTAWEVSDIVCVPQAGATEEFYNVSTSETDTGWMEVIFDASTLASHRWSGQGEVYIDFSRAGDFYRTIDVEYVAFFATKEEAQAYTCTIDQDIETLTNASFQCASKDVSTENVAHQTLSERIAALGLQSEYTLENGKFTAATEEENGSYSVDVVFNEEYQVTISMTITSPFPAPIAWTFDNSSVLGQFSGTNAKMVYEDGYLKMTTIKPKSDNGDGFFIAGSLAADEKFELGKYGYFKAKYRIYEAEDAPIQIYCFMEDGSNSSGTAYANVPEWEGDMVEIIIKVAGSAVGEEAIWIKNLETGETVKTSFASGDRTNLGKVSSIRYNLARKDNLDRTAYVEYMGFFTSYEAAVAYEGAAEERIEAAVEYLENNSLSINWGLASTEEKALQNIPTAVEAGGVGCTIDILSYEPATTTSTGSVTFDATLKSAEESRVLENLTVTINKKPAEPVVWRFNDSEFVSKLSFASVKTSVEDNVLKMVSTSPLNDDGFYFIVDLPDDTEQFYLEDYPYIRMKYKREGVGTAQLYYNSDAFNAGLPSLGVIGYGRQDGDWYTTIVDTGVRDYEHPVTYNYNHTTGEEEQIYYRTIDGVPPTKWVGLANHFRFNFSRVRNTDRTLELEYIAFFPTMEEARAYDAIEEAERLKSNAQLALKGYTGSNADYYEGHTQDEAKETALEKLTALLGNEVTAVINKVSYTAPVMNASNGTYVFTADICNKKGEVLYTTGQYTLTISSIVDKAPVVFTFTNPALIDRMDAINAKSMDYACMGLTNTLDITSFGLELQSTEQFYTEAHPFVAFKVNAQASDSKLVINRERYNLGDLISGETVIAIHMITGAVYKNGTLVEGITIQIPSGKVQTVGMEFNTASATVSYMAFFATQAETLAYDGTSEELQTAITTLKAETMESAYVDAKTEDEALAVAISKAKALLDAGVQVVEAETELLTYVPAQKTQTGSITFRVLVAAGSEIDTHYGYVELTMTISKKPSQAIVWTFGGEDGLSVSQLSTNGNATLTIEDNILHMDSKNADSSDGFDIIIGKNKVPMDFYLQDYPYIKVKYRYECNGWVGSAQHYAFSDEGTIGRTYEWSYGGANTDVWCGMLWDFNSNKVTVVDVDNNTLLGTQRMTDETPYRGKPSSFRFDMGRFTTATRHAEIEYIAFFSSREEAEAYEKDYYYDVYEFNGVEYATAKDNLTVAPKTIETAVRIEAGQNTAMTILSNRQEEMQNYYALETTAEGKVKFVYLGEEVLLSDSSIYDGKWHQLAVTLENGNAVLYVDGVAADTNTSFALADGISLKAPVMANDYVGETPFRGRIYYVRLFSTAQSQEQIQANSFNKSGAYNESLIAGWFTDKLVKYEQFADVCGANPMTIGDNYGKDGHEFLGEDYIKTEKELTAEAKTFEFWMKAPVSTASGTYTILSNKRDGNSNGITIALVNGQLKMVYNGTELFVTEGLTLSDNIWTHVAITLDDSISLYLDGVLVETYTTAYTEDGASQAAYYIGASLENAKTPFVGSLSDVRIWSSVKSKGAIQTNMMDYPTNADDLLASWRLDTQVYLEYTDYSSNENTATLYSSGWYKLDSIYGDYSLGAIGDTQSYMFGENALFTETFANLATKVDEFKMKHLFHLGDVTQVDSTVEWSFAREAFDQIEGILPYTIVPGNHDYPSPSSGAGAEMRDLSHMNAAFPRETYLNTEYFGGSYDDIDSANIYNFLNVGGVEYIIFGLEMGPRDDVLTWVSEILDKYPNKRAIILTHVYFEQPHNGNTEGIYTTNNANQSGGDFATANDGDDIWNKLVSKHNNIAMVLCGHSQNPHILYREDKNDYGTEVVQMMVDHSNVVSTFPSTEGMMTIFSFTNDGKMRTYWYSPLRDAYYQTTNEKTFDMSDALYGDTGMGTPRTTYAKKYDEIKEYRGETFTAPQADKYGYVFGGWYHDEALTQPLATTDLEGPAYAKFVDKDVLSVKTQVGLNAEKELPTDKTTLRFVTTVDSLQYRRVGFKIEMQRNEAAGIYSDAIDTYNPNDPNANFVYQKLYAMGKDNETLEYAPTAFSESSYRFKAWNLNNISSELYDVNFRARAYWVTLDGTMVEGAPSVRSVNGSKEVLK